MFQHFDMSCGTFDFVVDVSKLLWWRKLHTGNNHLTCASALPSCFGGTSLCFSGTPQHHMLSASGTISTLVRTTAHGSPLSSCHERCASQVPLTFILSSHYAYVSSISPHCMPHPASKWAVPFPHTFSTNIPHLTQGSCSGEMWRLAFILDGRVECESAIIKAKIKHLGPNSTTV